MISSEKGTLCIAAINFTSMVANFFLLWVYAAEYLLNYAAYSFTAAICMYVIARYLIVKTNYLFVNNILASKSIYISTGLFTAIISLYGSFQTIVLAKFSGMMFVSSVAFGAELGEFMKMRANNLKR
jgi:hypothetical protein